MAATELQLPAHDLKPGDRIVFDFRGDHLGEVEVFDAEPVIVADALVRLVLITADGDYRYRRVSSGTIFVVR